MKRDQWRYPVEAVNVPIVGARDQWLVLRLCSGAFRDKGLLSPREHTTSIK